MALSSHAEILIDSLIMHEELIAHLYELFAEQFPFEDSFWLSLREEELHHAAMLRDLKQKMIIDVVSFNLKDERSNIIAVRMAVNYVRSIITFVVRQHVNLAVASSMAVDVEGSLVEKGVFRLFTSEDQPTQLTIDALAHSFGTHIARIEQFRAMQHAQEA
ncbi:MAG TPA: hypothetical protein VGL77_07925 [Armatimonadota bacterium]|jgi:hypothetical protein